MTYKTLNPVPSLDPRDLDDNAQAFDGFLQSANASYPDRFGILRKTWSQMERDATALVSGNVAALAALTPAADKGVFFSAASPAAMGTYTLTSFVRGLGSAIDQGTFRAAIGALAATDTAAYAGSAAKLTTARTLSATGDATWSVTFDGSANASAAITLASTGTAGTYGTVTTDAKGRVTAGSVATPVANGGTGATTVAAAVTTLAAAKPSWTTYTPTVSGGYTTATATGKYVILFGICYFQIQITVTTKGTGAGLSVSTPIASLTGGVSVFAAKETAVSGKSGVGTLGSAASSIGVTAYDGTDLVAGNGYTIYLSGSYPTA